MNDEVRLHWPIFGGPRLIYPPAEVRERRKHSALREALWRAREVVRPAEIELNGKQKEPSLEQARHDAEIGTLVLLGAMYVYPPDEVDDELRAACERFRQLSTILDEGDYERGREMATRLAEDLAAYE